MAILKIFLVLIILIFIVIYGYYRFLLYRRPIRKFYEKRKADSDYCLYSEFNPRFIKFIVKMEDSEFFEHKGLDFVSLKCALIINHNAKKVVTGGSTITQQLAKNIFFNFKKNYFRKFIEAMIALKIEKVLTKEEILELYLNIVYYGNGIYGTGAACRFYYDKNVSELSLNQMFLTSDMLHAPTAANPLTHPDVLERIRNQSLERFHKIDMITKEEYELIKSHDHTNLDPDMRPWDEKYLQYSQVPLVNEKFGLPSPESEKWWENA